MDYRDNIIKMWMNKAKKRNQIRDGLSGDFQFAEILINCWISFEAYCCKKYQLERVGARIEAFCEDHQQVYEEYFDKFGDEFQRNLVQLSACQISDGRPNHGDDPPKQITDEKDLKQVMSSIYQVRNNLFHGGKDLGDNDNKIIVECSAVVFFKILEKFLIDEGLLDW